VGATISVAGLAPTLRPRTSVSRTLVSRASGAAITLVRSVAEREPDELVDRARDGDTAAFAELFRRHRSAVTAIAYRMMGPRADLEDMVQEVFLQVHRSLPDFRGQAKFSTWLHRVTVNVVLMARRRARSRPTYAHEDHARHESDDGMLPDQHVIRARRMEAFRRLLDRLSEKKRTVFVLHEIEGMPPAEIAELVGCPVLTVRTRLFYARKELTQLMASEPNLSPLLEAEEP
jgi:RNA polymerase sigma-70 factor (ECF subfamily)